MEKSIPGRRNSKYEDAEAGTCAWCVTEILFYCNVPGIQQARGKAVEDEIREVGKSRSGKNFALCCECTGSHGRVLRRGAACLKGITLSAV